MTKMVLVPADLLQATIRYLMSRPYAEVANVIPQLMACKPPIVLGEEESE